MATLNIPSKRHEGGQAIVELALTLPLLLVIVMGIFDFGVMFQRYELVTNAAREGARVGVLTGSGYSTNDAVARALQYLNVGGLNVTTRGSCGGALTPGTRCASVTQSTVTITGSSPAKTVSQVTVVVEYDHAYALIGPMMNLFGSSSLGTVRLRAVSSMRVE
jgi:Flp pilus assembly protein TadG